MNTIAPWRTFSIFISSTFSDMQAERDHLKNIVFPKVEEELRKKRIRLETVDLRWGVDTTSVNEDEREATILKVCLEEIERCKPFFIGLLGDRYGWVPPEERIELATTGRKLLLPNKGKSVTALEIEFGVLASIEQLNRSIFYLREPLPYDKLIPEKAAKFSDQYDPSLTADEKRTRKEALGNLKQAIKSHFQSINLQEKVKTYSAGRISDSGALVWDLESWGEIVYKDILAECERHAEDTWGETPKGQHKQELSLQEAFIEEHTHITITITEKGEEQVHTFCGRKNLIGELKEHLLSDEKDKWGIVLTGESGSGKSAVFSMMYKIMMKEDCLVLAHSAGISPGAKSVMALLQKWNRQLREFLGIKEAREEQEQEIRGIDVQRLYPGDIRETTPKTGIEKIQEHLAALLYQASEKKRVVLLIDALDCFEPTTRAEYMTWLPQTPLVNIRLLVTAITGTEKNAVHYHMGLVTRSIDHFTVEEAREMLYTLSRKQHKNLPKVVEREILEKERGDGLKSSSSPLWLSLALNIIMAIDGDDFEKISGLKGKGDEQIGSYMVDLVKQFPVLPGNLFLNLVEKAASIFGYPFTTTLFDLIACSRGGLRERDLEKLLPILTGQDWDMLQFASLRRWFRKHLIEQGDGHQWNLVHSILRKTLKEKIDAENCINLNIAISDHLSSLPSTDALRINETIYHLLHQDDKIAALEYYTSKLEDEELEGATKVLSETVTSGTLGMKLVASFSNLASGNNHILSVLSHRFIYTLDDTLAEEGNLYQRLWILTELNEVIEKLIGNNTQGWIGGYRISELIRRLAEIHSLMGHLEEALNYYEKLSVLENYLYEIDPDNTIQNLEFESSYSKIGEIHKLLDRTEEAILFFEKEQKLFREYSEAYPNNINIKIGLVNTYLKLGDIHQSIDQKEEALNYIEKGLRLCIELYNTSHLSVTLQDSFVSLYTKLGDIYREMMQLEEALIFFKKGLKLAKEFYDNNPTNYALKWNLGSLYYKIGDTYQEMEQMEEALNYSEEGQKIDLEIFETNPRSEARKSVLAFSFLKLGQIYKEMGRLEEALIYSDKCLMLAKDLYEANPSNIDLNERLGDSYYYHAMIYKALGNNKEGRRYFLCYKNIVSFLVKNFPQVQKYKDWDNLGY